MRSSKIVLNIISMIAFIVSGLTFMIPAWYFSYNTIINQSSLSSSISQTIKVYDFLTFDKVSNIYQSYGKSIEIIYAKIFYILFLITLSLSLIFIIFSFISLIKKLKAKRNLLIICNVLSILTIAASIMSLVMGIIFSITSKATIVDSEFVSYSLSINIASGVYLFTIFELAGAVCGNIACNLKESDD